MKLPMPNVPLCGSKKKFCVIGAEPHDDTCKLCCWGEYFCVVSSVSVTVFQYQKSSSLNKGTLFFRTTKERGKILSFLFNDCLSDFSVGHDSSRPLQSKDTELVIDKNDCVSAVHLHSGGLLVTSVSGLVGFVEVSGTQLLGATLPFHATEGTEWIKNETESSLLGISPTQTTLIIQVVGSTKVFVGESMKIAYQGSFVFKAVRSCECYNLFSFEKENVMTEISGNCALGTLSFRTIHNYGSPVSFLPIATLVVKVNDSQCISVYIGRTEFCVCLQSRSSVIQTLMMYNTSVEPFVFGSCSSELIASKCIIMLSRGDHSFECYRIEVNESVNKFYVVELETMKGYLPRGNVSYGICADEIVLVSHSGVGYHLYSFVGNEFILADNYQQDPSCIILLELADLSKGEYGMVSLSESGLCTLSTEERVVVVANIQQPHIISSLAVFREKQFIFCVAGCFDGSILVFKNGEHLWDNLFAHSCAISKIDHTEEFSICGSFFLSVSSSGGSICAHSRAGDIICCISQDSVIDDYFVDPSIGLIFLCTSARVCAWRLLDGGIERVFDKLTFLDLYMTGSSLSTREGLCICRHQLYNETFFSFAISVDALVNSLGTARNVRSEFMVALTILLSSCAACARKNCFSNSFMHIIDRLGLCVPPIASEDNFYYAIRMESALFDSALCPKDIVSICETSFSLHEGLLQHCKSSCIVPEYTLLKYYQYFKHSSCKSYTLCRAFFPYVVSTISNLEMIERFIQIFLSHKDKKESDFVDFMGTQIEQREFLGFLSTLSVVWRNTFDNVPQACRLPSLLHEVANSALISADHSSSCEKLNIITQLSNSFWLDSEKVDKKKWLDQVLSNSFENNNQSSLYSLECIASTDLYCFYEKYLAPLYHQKPQWRTALVNFQRRLIEKYQMESYYAPYPLFKTISSLFSTLTIFPKSEASQRTDENVGLIVASTKLLPNISFHRQLQSLAVGLRDGCVSVLNVKTNDFDSFVAHKAAILCIAYNTHCSSSHEIATVCEQMHKIKIWRAKINSSFISDFFSGSTKNFVLIKSIELPSSSGSVSTNSTDHSHEQFSVSQREPYKMNTPCFYRCSLMWITSSTIKFMTPWCGTLKFSI